MYLNNRLALPVNSSPVMVFPKQNFSSQSDVLRYWAFKGNVQSFQCMVLKWSTFKCKSFIILLIYIFDIYLLSI